MPTVSTMPRRAMSSLWTVSLPVLSRLTRRPAGRGAGRLGVLRLGALALGGALLGALAGCGGLTDPKLPAGVPDPASYRTPAGALALYRTAVADFQAVFPDFAGVAGALTDELQWSQYGGSPFVFSEEALYLVDIRIVGDHSGDVESVYGHLHGVRRNAVQALGALAKYDSAHHPALMGELYALEGYAELLLADLYCSGIPLSTVEFEGDFVLRAGSTTQQVYQHAVALFDSALALAGDSARILNLARVGKGRALLNLGQYDAAAAAVAAVPDAFRYQFPVVWPAAASLSGGGVASVLPQQTSVSDREGVTGLPYRSGGDPRTQVVQTTTNKNGLPVYFPAKYGETGSTTPIVLASGVEARLIEAETALHGVASSRGSWLAILNALRTTCLDAASCPSPAPAGSGGVAGLPPLEDPGSSAGDTARVNLVFRERAYWLFTTGTRQGDLRRLIRLYGRNQAQVYPSGIYFGPGGTYGGAVNAAVPSSEQQSNPQYQGCFNRGA